MFVTWKTSHLWEKIICTFSQWWQLMKVIKMQENLQCIFKYSHRKFDWKQYMWLFFILKKLFFSQKICLHDRASPKNKMLLTHHQGDFGNFFKKICQCFSKVNNPSKWLSGPRDFGKKLLSFFHGYTFLVHVVFLSSQRWLSLYK